MKYTVVHRGIQIMRQVPSAIGRSLSLRVLGEALLGYAGSASAPDAPSARTLRRSCKCWDVTYYKSSIAYERLVCSYERLV
jgi:hypothetical protein